MFLVSGKHEKWQIVESGLIIAEDKTESLKVCLNETVDEYESCSEAMPSDDKFEQLGEKSAASFLSSVDYSYGDTSSLHFTDSQVDTSFDNSSFRSSTSAYWDGHSFDSTTADESSTDDDTCNSSGTSNLSHYTDNDSQIKSEDGSETESDTESARSDASCSTVLTPSQSKKKGVSVSGAGDDAFQNMENLDKSSSAFDGDTSSASENVYIVVDEVATSSPSAEEKVESGDIMDHLVLPQKNPDPDAKAIIATCFEVDIGSGDEKMELSSNGVICYCKNEYKAAAKDTLEHLDRCKRTSGSFLKSNKVQDVDKVLDQLTPVAYKRLSSVSALTPSSVSSSPSSSTPQSTISAPRSSSLSLKPPSLTPPLSLPSIQEKKYVSCDVIDKAVVVNSTEVPLPDDLSENAESESEKILKKIKY